MNSQIKRYIRKGLAGSEQSFCYHRIRFVTLPNVWKCATTWKLDETHTTGNFMETSSHRHDYLLHFQTISALYSMGGRLDKDPRF